MKCDVNKNGIDIHNKKATYFVVLKNLKRCTEVSAKNKELIERFCRDCFAEGLSFGRVGKYVSFLKRICLTMNKDLELADKEDIKKIMYVFEMRYSSEWTVRDFKITLKKFYKWLRETEEAPHEVKWLKLRMKLHRQKAPEDMLTEEDVKKMIQN